MLDFLPGERLKFITLTIVDNPVPELEKIFRVELFTTDVAGEEYGPKSWNFSCIIRSDLSTPLSKSALYLQRKVKMIVFVPLFCVWVLCSCVLPANPPSHNTCPSLHTAPVCPRPDSTPRV